MKNILKKYRKIKTNLEKLIKMKNKSGKMKKIFTFFFRM